MEGGELRLPEASLDIGMSLRHGDGCPRLVTGRRVEQGGSYPSVTLARSRAWGWKLEWGGRLTNSVGEIFIEFQVDKMSKVEMHPAAQLSSCDTP